MTTNPHKRLVEALINIDYPRLVRLYETEAEFHAAIDTTAQVLPVIVGALADAAAQRDQARHLAQIKMEAGR